MNSEKQLLDSLVADLKEIWENQKESGRSGNPVAVAENSMLETRILNRMIHNMRLAEERGILQGN